MLLSFSLIFFYNSRIFLWNVLPGAFRLDATTENVFYFPNDKLFQPRKENTRLKHKFRSGWGAKTLRSSKGVLGLIKWSFIELFSDRQLEWKLGYALPLCSLVRKLWNQNSLGNSLRSIEQHWYFTVISWRWAGCRSTSYFLFHHGFYLKKSRVD